MFALVPCRTASLKGKGNFLCLSYAGCDTPKKGVCNCRQGEEKGVGAGEVWVGIPENYLVSRSNGGR